MIALLRLLGIGLTLMRGRRGFGILSNITWICGSHILVSGLNGFTQPKWLLVNCLCLFLNENYTLVSRKFPFSLWYFLGNECSTISLLLDVNLGNRSDFFCVISNQEFCQVKCNECKVKGVH